jgi:hypothetical protein
MTRLVISRSDNLSFYEEISIVNFSAWIQPGVGRLVRENQNYQEMKHP